MNVSLTRRKKFETNPNIYSRDGRNRMQNASSRLNGQT